MRRFRRILVTDSPTARPRSADVVVWLGADEPPELLGRGTLARPAVVARTPPRSTSRRGRRRSTSRWPSRSSSCSCSRTSAPRRLCARRESDVARVAVGCVAPPGPRPRRSPSSSCSPEQIAAAPALWQEHVRHERDRRFYVELHREPHVDVWLICWDAGRRRACTTTTARPERSSVVEGTLLEDFLAADGDGHIGLQTVAHRAGRRLQLRRDPHPRRSPRRRPAGHLDPRLLAGALADGPLRARAARARPGLAVVPRRGRAA